MSIGKDPIAHEELMAYLDGELAPDRAAETAEHLEQCPQCRQLAADLRDVSEMLTAWQVEAGQVERGLPQQIAAKLDESAQRKPAHSVLKVGDFSFPVRRAIAWGGAAAVVVLLVFAISRPSPLGPRPASQGSAALARLQEQANKAQGGASDNNGVRMLDGGGNGDAVDTKLIPPKSAPESRRAGGLEGHDSYSPRQQASGAPLPLATPQPGVGSVDKLSRTEVQDSTEVEGQNATDQPVVPAANGPMIIRTAELQITTETFDKTRSAVEEILKRHQGYVGELTVSTPTGSARSLTGTLRVPANQLEAALADLKGLGRTENESQGGQEVTAQYVDLEARLANSKHTEQRLTEMLRDRTGKLSDVLAVEMEISRVRGQIEQMEAERKTMKNQVDLATITITVNEAYKAELKAVPPSTGVQFRNAAVEGYRSLVDGIIAVLLWLLSAGPTLLLWAAILFFPAKIAWKRMKPRLAQKQTL